jgi:hypothetical protein
MEKVLDNDSIYNLFHLPLSTVAHQELHDLQNELNEITVIDQHDSWILQGSNATFSTKRIYRELIGTHDVPAAILDIWKTCNLPRQYFFAWLLMNMRLNTKDLMTRKSFFVEFKDSVLCDTCPEETIMHLFFECSFSMSFWWALGIEWNTDMQFHNMIKDAKSRYSLDFIMEIIITGYWSLWDQRNSFIFTKLIPLLTDVFINSRIPDEG